MQANFKMAARPSSMAKHGGMAAACLKMALNGVLSPLQTTKGIMELLVVEPSLTLGMRDTEKFALQFSRGLRALLTWFRDYATGLSRKAILRQLPSSQEAFLDHVVQNMVLKKKQVWDMNKTKQPLGLGCYPSVTFWSA